MIAILKKIRDAFVTLSWIDQLVDEKLISSVTARAIEGGIYSFYFGILTYLYNVIESGSFGDYKLAIGALLI